MQNEPDNAVTPGDEQAPEAQAFSMSGVAKHALVYGLGTIASRAVSFLMLPVYTRYLTPADYGVMGLIELTLDIIAIVAGAQLATGVFRYYHKTEKADEKKAVVSTAFLTLTASYGIVGAACFLGADLISGIVFPNADHSILIRLAAARIALQSTMIVPFAYARLTDRSTLFVTASLGNLLVGLTLNIVLIVGLGWGVLGVFASSLAATILTGMAMTVWTLGRVGVRFSRRATTDLLRFGIPIIGVEFATFAATYGDRFFLQGAGGEDVVGLYHLAYQFGFVLAMVGELPFKQIWAPKRFEVANLPNRDTILSDGFVYSTIWLVTLAVGMALFITDVFRVMTQPEFFSAAAVVPLILVAYVFQAWAGIQDIGILVKERTEYLTVANWIAAGVALTSYALLIPRYLVWGAAIGTVVSFVARWGFTYYFSQRLWPVSYRWEPVVRMSGFALAVVLLGALIPEQPILRSLFVHSALFAIYVMAVWNGGVLSRAEKSRLAEIAARGLEIARAWRVKRRMSRTT